MADGTPATPGQATAAWWAEQIFDRPPGRNTGDAVFTLVASLQPVSPVPDGARAPFVAKLAETVDDLLASDVNVDTSFVILGVDYRPEPTLERIADEFGIPSSRFPTKSDTLATCYYVTARAGYGSRQRLVWSDPAWVRPACGIEEYDKRWNRTGRRCARLRYHDEPCQFELTAEVGP